jgi:outer membrane protein W
MNYNETITSYNQDINGNQIASTDIYDYSIKTSKIGAMVTFNYHFVESDKFDAYFVTGLGYGNRNTTYASTNKDYIVPASTSSLFPVAARIGVGMRYFFTENIGANLGLGLGQGGLVNIGITAKF